MTTEFDVDTPADIELLGGAESEETTEVAEPEAEPTEEVIEQEAETEAVAEEPQEEDPAPQRDAVIPRARFDEVNAKLHAEREEVERLRAELAAKSNPVQQPGAVDIDALEDDHYESVMEGDKAKAKQIRATINAELFRRAKEESAVVVSNALAEREAKTDFAQAVSSVVSVYPFLDSTSPEADTVAIQKIVEQRNLYMAQGHSAASALIEAAELLAPLYAAAKSSRQSAPDPVTDKRKQTALATAARVSATQPPRVDAGVGNRAIPAGDSIIGNQDKWEKASEAERMRHLQ